MLLLLILLPVACAPTAPPRPTGLPVNAEWVGGYDGGAWIACRWQAKEPAATYSCSVFSDSSGSTWAEGQFVLAKSVPVGETQGVKYEAIADPIAGRPAYNSWDGSIIYLRDGSLLVPNGWVKYPLDGSHGKRVRYSTGKQVEEIDY